MMLRTVGLIMQTNPWPHVITDDFLSERLLNKAQDLCWEAIPNLNQRLKVRLTDEDDLYKYWYHRSLEVYYQFKDARKHTGFAMTLSGIDHNRSNVGIAHTDKATKLMTTTIYLWPFESKGTMLGKTEDNLDHTVPWKVNRALSFCRKENVTWHGFESLQGPRITLNLHLQYEPI